MSKRNAPSRAQLINLLIEERAKVIAYTEHEGGWKPGVDDDHRNQARREIEREVLTSGAPRAR